MTLLLLVIFLFISITGIVWGLWRKDRYYQFPTIFCATWFLYFGPQAIGAVINRDKYPNTLHADYGLQIALSYCMLCILMGLAGYRYGGMSKKKLFHFKDYSYDRLFLGGIILCCVGLWSAYELAQLSGGFVAQFTKGGHYGLEWRGAPVKYTFFARLIYPGFLLIFLVTLKRPSILRWTITILCLIYPLAVVVFLGRRSMAAIVAITILFSLFFVKRWAPSPLVQVLLFVLAFAGTLLAPAYRTKSQYGLHIQELKQIDARGIIMDEFSGQDYGEFDAIVYGCAATNRGQAFECGLGFYNDTIGALVPRQLVGEEFKSSLFFTFQKNVGELMARYYNWSIPYGSNPTGPFDTFRQFWVFGCLLYFILGFIYRSLWTSAYLEQNVGAQLWYVVTAVFIPRSVFGSFVGITPDFLVTLVFFGSFLYLAKFQMRSCHTNIEDLRDSKYYSSYPTITNSH